MENSLQLLWLALAPSCWMTPFLASQEKLNCLQLCGKHPPNDLKQIESPFLHKMSLTKAWNQFVGLVFLYPCFFSIEHVKMPAWLSCAGTLVVEYLQVHLLNLMVQKRSSQKVWLIPNLSWLCLDQLETRMVVREYFDSGII